MTPTTQESWEARFDKQFPATFHRTDGKDFIEISSYATTPESIKAFIKELAESEYERGVKNGAEVKGFLWTPKDLQQHDVEVRSQAIQEERERIAAIVQAHHKTNTYEGDYATLFHTTIDEILASLKDNPPTKP